MPRATTPPVLIAPSSPHGEGDARRPSKRRRPSDGALSGGRASPTAFSSTSSSQGHGSPSASSSKRLRVTRAATTTFADGDNDAYGAWLNTVQRGLYPRRWSEQPKFSSYIGKRVAVKPDDSDDWWTGVVSSLFVSPFARSSRRIPSDSSVRPSTDVDTHFRCAILCTEPDAEFRV